MKSKNSVMSSAAASRAVSGGRLNRVSISLRSEVVSRFTCADKVRLDPGRNHDQGHTESTLREISGQIIRSQLRRNVIRGRYGEGRHVIVESAAFVIGQDKCRIVPCGTGHQCVDDRLDVCGALLDVGVRMLVKILRLSPRRRVRVVSVFNEDELRQVLVSRGAGKQSEQVLDGLGSGTDSRIVPVRKLRQESTAGIVKFPIYSSILQAAEDGWACPLRMPGVEGNIRPCDVAQNRY